MATGRPSAPVLNGATGAASEAHPAPVYGPTTQGVVPPDRRLLAVRRALRKTLIYSDLFDFPLTLPELTAYLFDLGASEEEVAFAARLEEDVVEVSGYFALRGRQHLVAERRQRQKESERLWRTARGCGRLLAMLPFVRLVAVTGSLAPGNARPGDDVDLLLITAPGRLWLTRLAAIGMVRLARLFGAHLCPNFILSERALAIDCSVLPAYCARELAQMAPLFGHDAHRALVLANPWVAQFLPNFNPRQRSEVADDLSAIAALVKWAIEKLVSVPLFDRLESWEAGRKIRKLRVRHASEGGSVQLSRDCCKAHFGSHVPRLMALFELRCRALGMSLELGSG